MKIIPSKQETDVCDTGVCDTGVCDEYRDPLLLSPIEADLIDSLSGVLDLDLDFDLCDLLPLSTRSTAIPLDG